MLSADVEDGVFDPNMENVLEIPLRLLFMKFAVACDDDENNDDVADELVVVVVAVAEKFLLAVGVTAVIVVEMLENPLVNAVVLIIPLLLIALALGNKDDIAGLLANGVIVLYGVGVWSASVACSAIDVVNKLVLSPP